MAVTTDKIVARLKLNNGTDAQGQIKTVNVSLPSLVTTVTDSQILAVANAVEDILTKSIVKIEKITTQYITQ